MENELIERIDGQFIVTIYKSDNYMVAKFKTNEGPIVVTGPYFDYEKDQTYTLRGNYVNHPKYGFQFQILSFEKCLPTNKDQIIGFLGSNLFKKVGKKTATKIYDYFGDKVIALLKEDPNRINETNLSDKVKQSIIEGFKNMDDPENDTIFFLLSNGFNNNEAQKIYNKFKLNTIDISNDNPFRFYNEIDGMSFESVKRFARNFEFEDSENKYLESFVIHAITDYTFNTGDIYINEEDFYNVMANYGNINNLQEILQRCIEHKYITKEANRLYLTDDYNDELFIAQFLIAYKDDVDIDNQLLDGYIEGCQNKFNIKYDEKQKSAIYNFFNSEVSIVVGGPGTGKTTIVKSMVEIYKQIYPYNNLIVVAPTGRAAKRINEVCEVESKTIHSLLRWNLESNRFAFDMENPILYDAIIIDEFSMVDNNLFASLLKACSRVKKFCIIGDDNQLPSIRPGFVLNDLISSKIFKTTHLSLNYRQLNGSEIIDLADSIIKNNVQLNKYHKDITFIDSKAKSYDLISMINKDLHEGFDLNEIMILSPMYKGEKGIDNLNIMCQNAYNPKSPHKQEKSFEKFVFRENDKILQLKNRPNDDVYNGDIGILEEIDKQEKYLLVNYQGTLVFYTYEELKDISLAYAMSVHKAQGSEYQIVYLILNRNNIYMLNKNLIYTAISRAKRKLVIISETNVFERGISSDMKKRKTTLSYRLKV